MEMMKMQQTAGFKLHSCRQKRDEEVRTPKFTATHSLKIVHEFSRQASTNLNDQGVGIGQVSAELAAHWEATSQLCSAGAAVCRAFYDEREKVFAATARE